MRVDIVAPTTDDLSDYQLVLVPGLMHWDCALVNALENYTGVVLLGPRTGSKTTNFCIPPNMPPNLPVEISKANIKVQYVESLRQGVQRKLARGGFIRSWQESIITDANVIEELETGEAILVNQDNVHYLAAWPESVAMQRILSELAEKAEIQTIDMPEGLRIRDTQSHRFVINYNDHSVDFNGQTIEPAGVYWSNI